MKEQRNMLIAALMFVVITTSCNKVPMIAGEWYGTITRASDEREISKSALAFDGEHLTIMSDMLYSASTNQLKLTKIEGDVYFYESDSSKLNLQITLINDTLLAMGHNFKIEATKDSAKLSRFTISDKKYNTPIDIDLYTFGFWEGNLHRTSDNKILSKFTMSSDFDSLKIYSNAITGKDNIAWNLAKYNATTETFEYQTPQLHWKLQNGGDEILLQGDGCYAILTPVERLDNTFFRNVKVLTDPSLYLAGNQYKGKIIATGKHAIIAAFGEAYIEIDIIDNEYLWMTSTAKITNSDMALLAMFAGKAPEKKEKTKEKYVISNNTLSFNNDKFEIRENGNVLYAKYPEGMIELRNGAIIPDMNKERSIQNVVCDHCDGTGRQLKFSMVHQRRMWGQCGYCNGTGKRVTYD